MIKCRDLCVEFCSNSSPNRTHVSKQGMVFMVQQNGCFLKNGVMGLTF